MTSREKVLTRLDSTGIRREDEAAVPVNGVTVPLPYMVIRTIEKDAWDDLGRVCVKTIMWTIALFTANKDVALECKIRKALAISEHVANLLATIENPSSTAQALRIVFAATGEVTNPFLTDVKRQETLQIGTTAKPFVLHNGEVVTVTTSLSNMHIMLASRGVQTEITNKAVWPVAWLKLHPGENLFRYGAASGEQSLQVQIWHRQSYGGA